jgi:hypothetical protein
MPHSPDHTVDTVLDTITSLISGEAAGNGGPQQTISAEDSFAVDAMHTSPAATDPGPDLVRGLLIPHTDDPVQVVELPRDENGSVLRPVQGLLGGMVDAATCLSTLDFVVNADGYFLDDPAQFFNLRASSYRIGLWKAAVDGAYAVSDADMNQARELLDADRRDLALLGPVVVLGVDRRGGWRSAPDVLIERVLLAEQIAAARQQALRRILAVAVVSVLSNAAG